jgi:hypothetical protein
LPASEAKAIKAPSSLRLGYLLAPFPGTPVLLRLARSVTDPAAKPILVKKKEQRMKNVNNPRKRGLLRIRIRDKVLASHAGGSSIRRWLSAFSGSRIGTLSSQKAIY